MSMTIKRIAELCNTSRGTVDRVLNHRGSVNQELEKKILSVVEKYGFEPNHNARALVNIKNRYKIGVVINSLGNVFFDEVLEGIHDAANQAQNYGVQVEVVEIKGYSVSEQLKAVNKLVEEGISALALTPIRSDEIIQMIHDLKEKNIPTVLINADLDSSERLAVVSSNNRRSGEIAADVAGMVLPTCGKIGIVTGSFKNLGHIKRVSGFEEVIAKSEKQLEIAAIEENDDDDSKSYEAVAEMLKDNPTMDLIYFCAGGVSGGIRAMEDSGLPVHAITMDENETVRRYIESGRIYATITQQPYEQGARPITLLANYLALNIQPLQPKIHTQSEIKMKHSAW